MSVVLELRRQVAAMRRRLRDQGLDLVAPGAQRSVHPIRLALEQPLGAAAHAKRHNILLAANALDGLPLRPGQVFSFWHVVGRPQLARGFVAGRSLLAGELVQDPGGGLCQLAGALYHLSLQGGLVVVERWPHSVDLYREEERYTPLGADASVAWGFRDLRLYSRVELCFSIVMRTKSGGSGGGGGAEAEAATRDLERLSGERSALLGQVPIGIFVHHALGLHRLLLVHYLISPTSIAPMSRRCCCCSVAPGRSMRSRDAHASLALA